MGVVRNRGGEDTDVQDTWVCMDQKLNGSQEYNSAAKNLANHFWWQ